MNEKEIYGRRTGGRTERVGNCRKDADVKSYRKRKEGRRKKLMKKIRTNEI